ncbi:cobyrinate a,c-diamide synthase [Aeromicrobium chenweiae]|uniref:Hydrogenobyrinate a,c-diamide synthase n=1 Tax=Aeromicrobium chenweiae TaxID=2079793 RepID=A0A2S0WQR8_9ACTN|nr:cobyrinate a,c-diamide synthase [Aeromicrobium chenweiae]AWB93640.1 cobyrinic acid a,c-diamide synthase [Aeromicrobium chenweiae]TGN30511.1 cobyrinate a,c-diamide synthase [Aeromicrobium chenweiae]
MTATPTSLARLVIAAPASGHGKTTIATGLMAALSRAGHVVSGHKVGPDYIDPGYHALATGRPGRNLDPHMVGEHRLVPLLLHGARGADVAIVEGVMGLHDGQIGGEGFASTAHVATVTRTPVVLVVDISHASRSIAATVQGMVAFDPSVRVVGVILNKAGSERHAAEVVSALESTGLPVLGVLQRDDGIVAPSRHLGLVPADERDDAAHALDRLAAQIADRVDLAQLLALARSAPPLDATPWDPADVVHAPTTGRPVIAMAGGRAFTFRYAETEELLRAAGCDVVTFDPLTDERLPDGTAGLYLGGGFPEVHAAGLAANAPLRESLRAAVVAGMPTVAECAGLLYLCRSVDDLPMVGALDADAVMTPRLTLSYRSVVVPTDQLLGAAGTRVTGHEFHRTTVEPRAGGEPALLIDGVPHGFGSDTLHASYLHTHWAGHPRIAQRFADRVHSFVGPGTAAAAPAPTAPVRTSAPSPLSGPDARAWHGDRELAPGLVDLAVNIHDAPRPGWLDEALLAALHDVGAYPDPTRAEHAIARRHGRPADEVLATAGAAEAFGLVARARPWWRPVVVHPQFTEPDAALVAAGHTPEHVLCDPGAGFALDPARVPEDADLVVVGNPTNPTSVLHPERSLRALLRPGRVVVVDEAFMDAVPGERGSLAGTPLSGLLVVRSLTKLWSIPGVRAGYVLGDSALLADLRRQQPPWSVSAQAIAAMVATASEEARAEAAVRATAIAGWRAVLTDGLTELGIAFVAPAAPFVLAKVGRGTHRRLREAGYAVRRADTFPGLDDAWVRIAVRRPETTRKLLTTLITEGGARWS